MLSYLRHASRGIAPTVLVLTSLAAQHDGGAVDFNRDVRPLLSDRCFKCHGFDEAARKAGLRLDVREGQLAAIRGRRPVVPGDPDASELIARIESPDPKRRMPPPSSGLSLDPSEKALLRRWIEQGAPDPSEPRDRSRDHLTSIEGGHDRDDEVRLAFERGMESAGFSRAELEAARRMWRDFTARRAVRTHKPAVLAAAVEYAVALVHKRQGSTQATIARRYGVNPNSLSQRYSELREVLDLRPSDPRYCSAR